MKATGMATSRSSNTSVKPGAAQNDPGADGSSGLRIVGWRWEWSSIGLHRLHTRLRARGKPGNVTVVVAVARELACFLWAAATAD